MCLSLGNQICLVSVSLMWQSHFCLSRCGVKSRLQPLINLVMMNMSQLRTLPWQNTQEGKQTPGMSSKTRWLKGSGLTARRELSNVAAFAQQLPTVQTVKRDDQLWRRKTRLTFLQHVVKNRQQLCSYREVGKYFFSNFHWKLKWNLFTLLDMGFY